MPRATVNLSDVKKYDLKSCPGGFVVLRRLSYGSVLKRQEMAMQMKMRRMENQRGGRNSNKDAEIDLDMNTARVAEFDFAHCIVEHNLEDENGTLLDFRHGYIVHTLDPLIGQEIGDYINDMNGLNEEELGNSQTGSSGQLPAPVA